MSKRGIIRDIKKLTDEFNMFVDSAKRALTQPRGDKDVFVVQRVG